MSKNTNFQLVANSKGYRLNRSDVLAVARQRLTDGYTTTEVSESLPVTKTTAASLLAHLTRSSY